MQRGGWARRAPVAVTVLAAIAMHAAPTNAAGGRLEGKFKVSERLDASDDPRILKPGGTSDYKYKFACVDESCVSVTLNVKDRAPITLTKSGSSYTATTEPAATDCGPGSDATTSSVYTITPTKKSHGLVTKLRGTIISTVSGCEAFSYYNWSMKGVRK